MDESKTKFLKNKIHVRRFLSVVSKIVSCSVPLWPFAALEVDSAAVGGGRGWGGEGGACFFGHSRLCDERRGSSLYLLSLSLVRL